MKRVRWRTKRAAYLGLTAVSIYLATMMCYGLAVNETFKNDPGMFFPGQVSAQDINNPFEPGNGNSNLSNYSQRFARFEGFVAIMSAVNVHSHDLHLFAMPDQRAQIYRNFSIYIFSNQPCFYEIIIDDQLYERGYCEWKTKVKGSSPYSNMDVTVTLVNETNATLPKFNFKGLKLLDSPWEARAPEEEQPPGEEWIRMTQGEYNIWVLQRIAIGCFFIFLGVVNATSMATVRQDLRGVERVI